jgi:hypothetical protein
MRVTDLGTGGDNVRGAVDTDAMAALLTPLCRARCGGVAAKLIDDPFVGHTKLFVRYPIIDRIYDLSPATRRGARSPAIGPSCAAVECRPRPEPRPWHTLRGVHIDPAAKIAGHPALAVRDFLRRHANTVWYADRLAVVLKVPPTTARAIVKELARLGYVGRERTRGTRDPLWCVRDPGLRFASARGGPRLRRERADRLLAEMIARCEAANAQESFAYWVARLSVFGSYLSHKPTLGDLDVVLDLEPKERNMEAQMRRDVARWRLARAQGRCVTEDDLYLWADTEVRRFVRGRASYVQLCPRRDIEKLGIETRVVFEPKARDQHGGRDPRHGDPVRR